MSSFSCRSMGFSGLKQLRFVRYGDERGFFSEMLNLKACQDAGLPSYDYMQLNFSSSVQGALRGLHFQRPPHAQSKLVYVLEGTILDVVVDLRPNEPTYGKYTSIRLSGEDPLAFFIPKGFAHSFLALSKKALVLYATDHPYVKEAEGGIRYNDPKLGITWPSLDKDFIVSSKDLALGGFEESRDAFAGI